MAITRAIPGTLLTVCCFATALLIVACLLSFGATPQAAGLIPAPWDKIAHFAAYSTITALLLAGTRLRWPWAVLTLVFAIGACDELLQLRLLGRSADVADWLTDIAAGIITCATLLYVHHHISARNESSEAA